MVFGLNALLREGARQSGAWAGANAAALLRADAARARGALQLQPMHGYELGNEVLRPFHLWLVFFDIAATPKNYTSGP